MRPKVIYFCNKKIGEIEKKVTGNWARLNPEYEIRLYDDEKCKEFLLSHYGKLYSEIFEYIEEGPIKADFWRVCILYANGGIYSDIDNEPLVPVDEWINEKADFVICSSYICFNYNPNFIVSERNNTILKRCIDWYVNKYERKDAYSYWGWSIMTAFNHCLHIDNYEKVCNMYNYDGMIIQILEERPGNSHYDAHNICNGVRVFNNRYRNWNYSEHRFM